jgi:hypothetical protein
MNHEFEEYQGPERHDSQHIFTQGNNRIEINLQMNVVYACKMMRCKYCGIKVAVESEQPKFETCEEVYVDEVMGS